MGSKVGSSSDNLATKILRSVYRKMHNKEPLLAIMVEAGKKETALATIARYASDDNVLTRGKEKIIKRYGKSLDQNLFTFCGSQEIIVLE
jgi:hypothetical protein